MVKRARTALALGAWVLCVGLVCAVVATNISTLVGEVYYPLPYPLDEEPEQAARFELYDSIGSAAFVVGGVTGFLIFLARYRTRARPSMKAI